MQQRPRAVLFVLMVLALAVGLSAGRAQAADRAIPMADVMSFNAPSVISQSLKDKDKDKDKDKERKTVPEPSASLTLGMALFGLAGYTWWTRKKSQGLS